MSDPLDGTTIGADQTVPVRFDSAPPDTSGLAALGIGSEGSLVVGSLLGEGGMGRVDTAEDTLLGRIVAIKRPRTEHPRLAATLLAEARTLARLDHPAIVPIHAIGLDGSGVPTIVMKRIVGRPWRQIVEEGADLLRDLGIALRIAEALRFAHTRGVLHRDVKLDNVMIGEFGEVYLMDWGCACALASATTTDVVGTPSYMAPEMKRVGEPIGAGTDVYLLAATIQRAIPHAPSELFALLRAAQAESLADRPTIEAFVAGIEAFLRHREASRIAEAAGRALQALEAAVSSNDLRADSAFAEARFGFRSALTAWPDCQPARTGLERAFGVWVPWKLATGELGAVEALLPEIADPEPVRAEIERTRARVAKAHELAEGRDPRRFGSDRRAMLLFALGPACGALAIVMLATGARPLDATGILVTAAIGVLLILGAIVPFWARLTHRATRDFALGLLLITLMSLLHRVYDTIGGVPPAATVRNDTAMFAAAVVSLGLVVDPIYALSAAPYWLAFVIMLVWPGHESQLFPASVLLSLATGALLMGREQVAGSR